MKQDGAKTMTKQDWLLLVNARPKRWNPAVTKQSVLLAENVSPAKQKQNSARVPIWLSSAGSLVERKGARSARTVPG